MDGANLSVFYWLINQYVVHRGRSQPEAPRKMSDPDFSTFPLRPKGRQYQDFQVGQVLDHHWGRTPRRTPHPAPWPSTTVPRPAVTIA